MPLGIAALTIDFIQGPLAHTFSRHSGVEILGPLVAGAGRNFAQRQPVLDLVDGELTSV